MNKRTYNVLRKVAADPFKVVPNYPPALYRDLILDQLEKIEDMSFEDRNTARGFLAELAQQPYIKRLADIGRYVTSEPGIHHGARKAVVRDAIRYANNLLRAPAALDAMKKGKTVGAGAGGALGLATGLALAKDKSLLAKILYGTGGTLVGAGAGAALGDTVADYLA